MPRYRVTSAASKLIVAGKKAGKSSREIAEEVRNELGIELDQRTISRHVASIEGRGRDRSGESRKRAGKRPGAGGRGGRLGVEGLEHDGYEPTLDEVEALERQAKKLQHLLGFDLPPRDRAALNAELRQTFASIRKALTARRMAEQSQSADASWVVAKLKRFVAMNRGETPDDAGTGDVRVHEAAGSAGG